MTAHKAASGTTGPRPRAPESRPPARRLKATSRRELIRKFKSPIPGISVFTGGVLSSVLIRLPSQPSEELRPLIERFEDIQSATPPSVEEFAERARKIRHQVYEEHYGRGGKSAKD